MQTDAILITGAAGEIGQALLAELAAAGKGPLVTLDLQAMPAGAQPSQHVQGSVADPAVLARLEAEYEFAQIFHLAALLSTSAERKPALAHEVNVDASVQLLELAARQSARRGQAVQFIFPSSIAVYGLPDLATKAAQPRVAEDDFNDPTTMYGCNKLAVEKLGAYYARHYGQLLEAQTRLDFRSLRFPGLISAHTAPTGGTSDYGPEMLHAAAQGQAYACFVRPDTTIPFMAMPDAVQALLGLAAAPAATLSRRAYNVGAFSLNAAEFAAQVQAAFAEAEIGYAPNGPRQGIVDTWPMDVEDEAARRDWGWTPQYDLARSFGEYLVPHIRQRYA